MLEKHIEVSIKAPYYALNEPGDKIHTIWFVCHGYGQLSRYFLQQFEILDPKGNFLIFPQGLHRFYLQGHQKVGASWMTKEDRLTDIQNQHSYLDQVWNDATRELDLRNIKVYFMGFSQGVATISRYLMHTQRAISKLILWAGMFPPELSSKDFEFLGDDCVVQYYYGTNDQYYEQSVFREEILKIEKALNRTVEAHMFSGKHEIMKELLKEL